MGISAKAKSGGDGWGLGLLLVFFPEDENDDIEKKTKLLSCSSCSSSPSSSFKSTGSSRCGNHNLLINKAQSTMSICALIVFFTLLVFTLCTFEPTTNAINSLSQPSTRPPRRWLAENSKDYQRYMSRKKRSSLSSSWFGTLWKGGVRNQNSSLASDSSIALQRMGTLFRRGTRAMSDLVVAHVKEDVTDDELRLFMRTLHRSGLTARSDVVLVFPSLSLASTPGIPSNFSSVIREENESFLRLVRHFRGNKSSTPGSVVGFDVTQFVKSDKKQKQAAEPLWGRRTHGNYSGPEAGGGEDELSWGSVVGFDAAELDPENSLAGFLDHVPMALRRWACYPMLLGRVRRNFKHLMLVDVKNVLVLGDALSRVRNRNSETVYLSATATTENAHGKHGRRNSEKTQSRNQKDSKLLNPEVIMGGTRGVRRLSNAMLTAIVRVSMQQKSKASVSESGLLNQLVQNGLLLKNIELIRATESIPDSSSLTNQKSNSSSPSSSHSIVHHGNHGNSNINLKSILLRELCSSVIGLSSSVYRDC
ncbi:PREDICTED: uncharacterized protein LOC104606327 [Nelumbo nucifera]|uniref:Uncharacterized protein LOC104606327 n=1 Tax=Nelumbo nucifera TaxID=4432 RepID=A0A1U8B2D0_NELNU|nr:PREDICTED: uncharacterized protein LOC104606327 [Nelumbo nucifera]